MILFTMSEVMRELRREEQYRKSVYKDSKGLWTIGIGTLVDASRNAGITLKEAEYLCGNRVEEKVIELDRALPWWRDLSDTRQRVLVNMAYQMGTMGVLGFQNFLGDARSGQHKNAAKEMLDSQWAREDSPARAHRMSVAWETDVMPW